MKRALLICLVASPLFALTPLPKGNRVGVLRVNESVATAIGNQLRSELGARGFNAFDARGTFEDVKRGKGEPADYYVEIVESDASQNQLGGVGAAVGPAVVDMGIVTARVTAELRVYDGRTLELLDRYDLHDTKTGIAPTGVGLRGYAFFGYIALPLIQRYQYHAATHHVAIQAAELFAHR
jgi:hypothetical protein